MLPLNQMHLRGIWIPLPEALTAEEILPLLWIACITKLALDKVLQELGFEVFSEQRGFWNSICKSMWALSPSRTCSWAQGRGHSRWNNKQLIFGPPVFLPWQSSTGKTSKGQHAVCSSPLLFSPVHVPQASSCLRCPTRDISKWESSCWDVTG